MNMSKNLVPILHKNEFDNIASDFLKKYYPQALEVPMMIPIEDIAVLQMKLQVKRVHLSDDLSILGQIFFNAGRAEVYLKETDEVVYDTVDKGMMFIDPDVAIQRNVGCERNTIAHECVHWRIHRQYYAVQTLAGGEKAVASRCPIEPPAEQFKSTWTDEDWMEWHANGIAPKILMPQSTFLHYVKEHPHYVKMQGCKQNVASIYLDLLISDLADFFQVSKQSASIRLSELGLI